MMKVWAAIGLLGMSHQVYAQVEPWSFDWNINQSQGAGVPFNGYPYGSCLDGPSPMVEADFLLYEEGASTCREIMAPEGWEMGPFQIEQTILSIQEGSLSFGVFADSMAQLITVTPTQIGVLEIPVDPASPWATYDDQPLVADLDGSQPHVLRLIRYQDEQGDDFLRLLVDGEEVLRFGQWAFPSLDELQPHLGFPLWGLAGQAAIGISPYGQSTHVEQLGFLYIIGPSEEPTPADVNGDGLVGVQDLLEIIGSWGQCPSMPEPCQADFAAPLMTVGVPELLENLGSW